MDNTILIVDDEKEVISALQRSLMEEHYIIYTAGRGVEGLDLIRNNNIKLIISDEMMPGMSGSEFLAEVKNICPETIRIILTGHASIEAAMRAVNNGEIYRFFSKPWNDIELKLAIRSAIERYDLEHENRMLLKTVKRQANELTQLEKLHPGITNIEKDEEGNLILPDIADSDKELTEIFTESEVSEKNRRSEAP